VGPPGAGPGQDDPDRPEPAVPPDQPLRRPVQRLQGRPRRVARQEPRDQRRRAHVQGAPRGRRQDTRQAGRPERHRRQGRRRQDQPGRAAQGGRGARRDRPGLHRPRPRRSPRPAGQGSRAAPRAGQDRAPHPRRPADRDQPRRLPARAPDRHDPRHLPVPRGRRQARALHRAAPEGRHAQRGRALHQPPPVRLRRHDAVRAVRAPPGPAVLHVHRPQLPAAGPRPDRAARQVRQPREGPRGRPEGQQGPGGLRRRPTEVRAAGPPRSPSPARATCSTRSSPRPTSGGSPSRTRATT
jgi:hypothetical protein